MNYEQFAIWLHGFLEISNAETIDQNQTQIIKDHLALLFEKKTPIRREKKEDNSFEHLKKLAEEIEKRRPKDIEYPKYPPYPPMPMPTYPGFNPYKITCGETPLGEQFVGVDLNTEFDRELHKGKTYC